MVPDKEDFDILRSPEVRALRKAYEKKFGECVPCFNYADFGDRDGKIAGQIYKEALEKALEEGKPYRFESKAEKLGELFGHY